MPTQPECTPLGECALLLRWGTAMDAALNRRIVAFAHQLMAAPFRGFQEAAPAYCSLAVYYDPAVSNFAGTQAALRARWDHADEAAPATPRTIEIPVQYGGEDLTAMSRVTGLAESDIIAIHAGRAYHVYLMGFLPGFAYLGDVDQRIALPRHTTPRLRVEAGSVGIAGKQTGVYPVASPGGWQIIGRTELPLFNPSDAEPVLLAPGDQVRFVAI